MFCHLGDALKCIHYRQLFKLCQIKITFKVDVINSHLDDFLCGILWELGSLTLRPRLLLRIKMKGSQG